MQQQLEEEQLLHGGGPADYPMQVLCVRCVRVHSVACWCAALESCACPARPPTCPQLAAELGPLPSNVLCVRLWPGQPLVLTGAASGAVQLHCLDDAQQQPWTTQLLPDCSGVLTLELLPCDAASTPRLLLAGCMGVSVHVLDAATGRLLASCCHHRKYVVAATWAPGGGLIASGSWDSSVCLLRLTFSSEQSDGDAGGLQSA